MLAELKPRIDRLIGRYHGYILFADAATSTPIISGVFFLPREKEIPHLTKGRAPSAWLRRFHRRNKISGVELLAPLDSLWAHQCLIRNTACAIYLDRNNAIDALLRGGSCDSFISPTVTVFRKLPQKMGMPIRPGRAKSKLNVADLPTRNLHVPYEAEHISGFKQLLALLNECLSRLD